MPLVESAASGQRLAALQDVRDLLARQIQDCDSNRDMAALVARFQSVLSEISELSAAAGKGGDPIDEIAARRAARGGSTARPGRTAGGPV